MIKSSLESNLISELKKQIELHLNWGSSNEWTNSNFLKIRELILLNTKIDLSVTTLKRLWKRSSYEGGLSITTLNTLAKFINYTDWYDFIEKNSTDHFKTFEILKKYPDKFQINTKIKKIIYSLLILIFLLVTFLFAFRTLKRERINITLINSIDSIPYVAVFKYQIKNRKSDSLYIINNFNNIKKFLVNDSGYVKFLISYPGFNRFDIIKNNLSIKSFNTFSYTKNWVGIIRSSTIVGSKIHFFSYDSLQTESGYIGLSENSINSDFIRDKFFDIHNISPSFSIFKDSFIIKTKFKSIKYIKGELCPKTEFTLLFENKQPFSIQFTEKNCDLLIDLWISDLYQSGTNTNLKDLCLNINEFNEFQFEINPNTILIQINKNKKLVFFIHKPLGKLMGIKYRFYGHLGKIDYILIKSKSNNNLYYNDFTKLK